MSEKIALGLLNLGAIMPQTKAANEIGNLVEMVPLAEKLGYTRYWLSEHHSTQSAWRSPEILLALLAGSTEKIKVGAAGILLNYYSPLKVAQNFKLLEAFFGGRIDLGVARGRIDEYSCKALLGENEYRAEFDLDYYSKKVGELIHFLNGTFPKENPYSNISVPPQEVKSPEIWVLGSGDSSVSLAIDNNTSFSYAFFLHSNDNASVVLKKYLVDYELRYQKKASCNIAVAGICAETDTKAEQLMKKITNSSVNLTVYGDPDTCKEKMVALQKQYGINEFIFCDMCTTYEDKVNSITLLAKSIIEF